MIELADLRAFALALPEVQEGPSVPPSRRIAAFKVPGKSFVGVEQGVWTMAISLGEQEAKALMATRAHAYEAIWREGKRVPRAPGGPVESVGGPRAKAGRALVAPQRAAARRR